MSPRIASSVMGKGGYGAGRSSIFESDLVSFSSKFWTLSRCFENACNGLDGPQLASAIFGGAVVGWVDESGAHAVPIRVREDLRTTLLIPESELLTETARSVLPEKVPHKDAAFNASRTALLVLALEHDPSVLFEATEERSCITRTVIGTAPIPRPQLPVRLVFLRRGEL